MAMINNYSTKTKYLIEKVLLVNSQSEKRHIDFMKKLKDNGIITTDGCLYGLPKVNEPK